MIRIKAALAASAVALATLTACGEQVKDVTDKAGDVTGAVTDKAGEVTGAVTDKAGEVTGAVTDTVEGAKDKVAETAEGAKDAVGNIASLGDVPAFTASANSALDAVKNGDFDTAKTEVAKLQESWGSIADKVKEKSPEVHTKIEEGVGSVKSALDGDTPDAAKIQSTITDIIASVKDISL
ncbi:MAG: hypothetical protein AAGB01_04620 [Cyanobacteria bacterium P01_F01_bin.42]